ncbi:fumarylacetoacetate hydrolase family protein [Bacillus sp. AGMB 02131]|uniref:Fumarylacetoacetate hydrolase family protein n=1 Tax=Peribacillus faecalis TaxID=2772559 RepID=A0A927CXH9_9BACI|nr:fumarylacetoacetate hydrolase family protein [Peribacillus faecalis]MBD3107129.1 fumarylacetoacetate hydrolase family protein [Peribacillus faecalis]
MLQTYTIDSIAYELFKAEKEVYEVTKFVDRYPDLNIDVAYDIQDRLIDIKCAEEATKIVGRKLGLTSRAKQVMMGVHEPSYGVLLENMKLPLDEPISLKPLIHPKIEPEIAFVFKKDLAGPVVTVADVLEATAYVAPAMEIIDSRYQNFQFTLADVIADNSSSSRYFVSEKKYSVEEVDLRLMGCVFKKNGEIIATSAAASVMGHPARAIAWMANKLLARGQSIKAGELVLSGALTGAATISEDDTFSVSFDGMEQIAASFVK